MTFARTPQPSVEVTRRSDGTIELRSGLALPRCYKSLAHLFDEVTLAHPDRVFMKQRDTIKSWRQITYSEARRAADGLAQWLIDRGVGVGDSVAFLSAPSIEHGIAAIGVQRCGAALVPISTAYSLLSKDHVRLRECLNAVNARVVIVDDADRYAAALRAIDGAGRILVTARGAPPGVDTVSWEEVVATTPTSAVAEHMAAIGPDTIARIMFTSGSTGTPKATPQTHAYLNVTIAQVEAVNLHDFGGEAPQMLEAMPFSHIMAGNFNFNNVIRAGGTMWIDEGKPTPVLMDQTIANLRDVSPHFFLTVPLGYAMLCDAMEGDADLRDRFFRNLRYIGFGGAVLPASVEQRLLALSRSARGAETPIFSFYGATEYMFGALKYWAGGSTEVIGLPLPSTELKLVPLDDRYELLMRGPTRMPRTGYIGDPGASDGLFDDEGYFRTGDAVRFADTDRPELGLVFAGRLADDFKLSSGTFVAAAALRNDLVKACSPLVSEIVLCGVNEDFVGALMWGVGEQTETFRVALQTRIAEFNACQSGSARKVGSALLMRTPLSLDLGELTDKGNVAPRIVRGQRASNVASLFDKNIDPSVMFFGSNDASAISIEYKESLVSA